ncbi:MAG: glycosyltransferase family 9 protein [Chitinophagaceae bacterium]
MAIKFLIIRFSSIGDIVLTTPVMRCLKKQVPLSEVHFLTKHLFKIVTASNPYIDKFFYYDNNLNEIIEELKIENYDYVIDLHDNFRSNKIKRELKKKSFTVDKLTVQKFFLTRLHLNFMPGIHITKRSLETVKSFGVKDDGLGLDYFIPDNDKVSENDLPTSHLAGYIAIVIGASYRTKKLPVHKLQELCIKIPLPVILVGGEEDVKEGMMVSKIDPIKIYNACGKFNLNESADLVRRSLLVISNDTGLQYIASAFKKPIIAIWGSTSPKLDVEPFYGDLFMKHQTGKIYENIMVPGLWCQPCSKYGRDKCPLGHFKCMKKISIDKIVNHVNILLRK